MEDSAKNIQGTTFIRFVPVSWQQLSSRRELAKPLEEKELWWRRRESNPPRSCFLSHCSLITYNVRPSSPKVLRSLIVCQNYAEFIRVLPQRYSRVTPASCVFFVVRFGSQSICDGIQSAECLKGIILEYARGHVPTSGAMNNSRTYVVC